MGCKQHAWHVRSTLLVFLVFAWIGVLPVAAQAPQPSSSPSNLVYLNGLVFFTAEEELYGRELWVYDTASETSRLVIDLTPGPGSTTFSSFFQKTRDFVFFLVTTLDQSQILYRSDGTEAGTIPLKHFDMKSNHRAMFMGATDEMVFIDFIGSIEDERGLWRSDGSMAGTLCLNCNTDVNYFTTSVIGENGKSWFASHNGGMIVVSDGSPEGTRLFYDQATSVTEIALLPGKVVAAHISTGVGLELHVLDKQSGKLIEVLDVCPGKCSGAASPNMFRLGDELLFKGDDGVHGTELWITDGTVAGTRLLKDINPGLGGSDPYRFTKVRDLCFFSATTSEFGRELWVTDGTSAGTRLTKDINPGVASAGPYAFASTNEVLYFTANDGVHGDELWISEATEQSTRMVKDIYPGPESSSPYDTVSAHNVIYFSALHPDSGRELWTSSGHGSGTRLAADIWSRPFFNPGSSPRQLTPLGDKLFFVLNDLEHGAELWVTEGDPEDARLVKDIYPGPASSTPHHLTPFNGYLYFAAENGTYGVELWRSDGTQEGTGMVEDLGFGANSSAPRELVVSPESSRLYFVANSPIPHIHYVDSQLVGTGVVIQEIRDTSQWNPRNLTNWNGQLFFTADDGIHGEELWYIDKTYNRVRLFRDFVTSPVEVTNAEYLTPLGDRLFYVGEDGQGNRRILAAPQSAIEEAHVEAEEDGPEQGDDDEK